MNGWTSIFAITVILSILGAYVTYALSNASVDGAIFGSVIGLIGAIAAGALGFQLGWLRPPPATK